jgi:hypothetical protein
MSNADQIPEPVTKPCRVCGEDIKLTARKCPHCASYQDWRGGLGLSTEVLALLVALISIATAGTPIILNALTPRESQLHFSVASVGAGYVSMFVTNSGARPGLVWGQARISVQGEKGMRVSFPGFPSTDTVIPPETSALIRFQPSPGDLPFYGWDGDRICSVAITTTNFDGEDNSVEVPFDCRKMPTQPPALDRSAIAPAPK